VAEFIDNRKTPGYIKIRRKKLLLYNWLRFDLLEGMKGQGTCVMYFDLLEGMKGQGTCVMYNVSDFFWSSYWPRAWPRARATLDEAPD